LGVGSEFKGWFRVYLNYIVHLGVYLGLRNKKAETSRKAEQWRSREAKKQNFNDAEKQGKKKSRKTKKQGNRNPKSMPKTEKKQ
jgi:hypothetical protein